MFKHVRASFSPEGKAITIDLVHPHVFIPEKDRSSLLKAVVEDSGRNHILAGDFNAYSPDDAYDSKKVVEAYKILLDSPEEAQPLVNDLLTCQAVQAIKERGFVDSYRKFHHGKQERTVPTSLLLGGDDGTRMDYIFCSPDLNIVGAGIYTGPKAFIASDHFPVWAVIEI